MGLCSPLSPAGVQASAGVQLPPLSLATGSFPLTVLAPGLEDFPCLPAGSFILFLTTLGAHPTIAF